MFPNETGGSNHELGPSLSHNVPKTFMLNLGGAETERDWLRSSSFSKFGDIGWWSEESLVKILDEIMKFSSIKELWMRKRSKRVAMLAEPTLLLDQVYHPFLGLISFNSQTWINSSTVSWKWSLPQTPPFFSFGARDILRSPVNIIFEGALVSMKFDSVLQHSFFFIKSNRNIKIE